MINPVVVDNSLKLYFPVTDGEVSSAVNSQNLYAIGGSFSQSSNVGICWGSRKGRNTYASSWQQKINTAFNGTIFLYGMPDADSSDDKLVQELRQLHQLSSRGTLSSLGQLFKGLASTIDSYQVEADLNLRKMIDLEASISRRRALDFMYDLVEGAFEEENLRMLDHMLILSTDRLIKHSLSVSFLRATSRARGKLKNWKSYELLVRLSLVGHPNEKKLLKGL